MFSEHVGKKKRENNMSAKKKKESTFDSLEEKINEGVAKLSVKDSKLERKYTPSEEDQQARKKSLKKDKPSSASLILPSDAKKEPTRSNSFDKKEKLGGVGIGLFEAANVMCNIVDITKDSTMRRKPSGAEQPASAIPAAIHGKPTKSGSKSSLTSQTSQSGPFAAMKENAQKKKKSIDVDDD